MECGFQIRFKLCSYWLVTGFCKTKRRLTENSYLHQLERQKHSVVGIPCMKNSGLQSWLSPIQIVRRLWNSWSWPQLQRCSKTLHCRSVSLCCVDSRLQYVKDIQGYESKKDFEFWFWGRRWLETSLVSVKVLYKVVVPCSNPSLFSFGIWIWFRMSFVFRFGSLSAPYLGDEDAQRVVAWDQWQWQEWMFFFVEWPRPPRGSL